MATANETPTDAPGEVAAREALQADAAALERLAPKMQAAMDLRREGDEEAAAILLKQIVQTEPRLAEPRLELAHQAALRADWEEAREQARYAVDLLTAGGQWTAEVPPQVLLGFALNLLGETIVRPIEEGDLFLTDRERFTALWNEAAALFVQARTLDPDNEDARRNTARYRAL